MGFAEEVLERVGKVSGTREWRVLEERGERRVGGSGPAQGELVVLELLSDDVRMRVVQDRGLEHVDVWCPGDGAARWVAWEIVALAAGLSTEESFEKKYRSLVESLDLDTWELPPTLACEESVAAIVRSPEAVVKAGRNVIGLARAEQSLASVGRRALAGLREHTDGQLPGRSDGTDESTALGALAEEARAERLRRRALAERAKAERRSAQVASVRGRVVRPKGTAQAQKGRVIQKSGIVGTGSAGGRRSSKSGAAGTKSAGGREDSAEESPAAATKRRATDDKT